MPDGGFADTVTGREIAFGQLLPRRQFAGDDRQLERLVEMVLDLPFEWFVQVEILALP